MSVKTSGGGRTCKKRQKMAKKNVFFPISGKSISDISKNFLTRNHKYGGATFCEKIMSIKSFLKILDRGGRFLIFWILGIFFHFFNNLRCPWGSINTKKSPWGHVCDYKIWLGCGMMLPFNFSDRYNPKEACNHTYWVPVRNRKILRDTQSQASLPLKSIFFWRFQNGLSHFCLWGGIKIDKSPSTHVWVCKMWLGCRMVFPSVFVNKYDPKEACKLTYLPLVTKWMHLQIVLAKMKFSQTF